MNAVSIPVLEEFEVLSPSCIEIVQMNVTLTYIRKELERKKPRYSSVSGREPGSLARRSGGDGFSVESAGSGKHPFSPSSDSLTNALAPTVNKLPMTKLFVDYVMYSSFAYRQFNSNFTCSDPTILMHRAKHCSPSSSFILR
ncbi:hypothetical protein AVEN_188924-1 [Araneus ventricosus]|uniref:Uncharacterized protein n=1 Tax=Araneus ventricosus TaxID=182803 RepID=A0A4Y2WJ49_ARAVE|nr:hypothetical protein AVEN_251512-1 [Araneus ventricosus]GBO36400.1 hypothetical protein AVEN_188924-1 [Araneus ventricosus]